MASRFVESLNNTLEDPIIPTYEQVVETYKHDMRKYKIYSKALKDL